ncbi:MAG TPA: phosphoribosyltransferase family protein [Acidimicrobiales bacterium]|nr:phosphoribosyltransferase family protein [Acidimicrobiales bacterium]
MSIDLSRVRDLCQRSLAPASCRRCPLDLSGPCSSCVDSLGPEPLLKVPSGVDRVRALSTYRGPGGRIVRSIKYANGRTPVTDLGRAMAALVPDRPDLVTWVPTTVERRGRRGFDQAEELARSVAAALGQPCRRLLARAPGAAQTDLAARQRRQGSPFRARTAASGSSVLLVDDVTTTGASLTAAATALRAAGATSVEAVVVAVTQPGGTRKRARSLDRSIGSPRGRTR